MNRPEHYTAALISVAEQYGESTVSFLRHDERPTEWAWSVQIGGYQEKDSSSYQAFECGSTLPAAVINALAALYDKLHQD